MVKDKKGKDSSRRKVSSTQIHISNWWMFLFYKQHAELEGFRLKVSQNIMKYLIANLSSKPNYNNERPIVSLQALRTVARLRVKSAREIKVNFHFTVEQLPFAEYVFVLMAY